MAKKKVEEATKSGFSFEKFDKALSKVPGMELGSIIETNTFSTTTEWIDTGNYLLNAVLSGSMFGGVPNSRSLGLVGDPETGKTFIALNIVKRAQEQGYYVLWCDTEGALEKEDVVRFGIDTKRFRYEPTKTVEKFKIFLANVITMKADIKKETGEDPKFIVVVDSLGMLNTQKEVNDLADNQVKSDMGIKAKQVRSLFRAITLDMTGEKMPLICTNHTTIGGIGSYTGPTKESAGGDGPIFAMSNVLFISKKEIKEGEGDAKTSTGILITVKPKKARKTQKKIIQIHVSYKKGMNPYVGLEEWVNWDACGIQRGKIMTVKEYDKTGGKNGKPFTHIFNDVDKETGEVLKERKEDLIFVPSETGRWCVKHFGKSVASGKELFSSAVYTDAVLHQLDDNVIKGEFMIPDKDDEEELSSLVEDTEESVED